MQFWCQMTSGHNNKIYLLASKQSIGRKLKFNIPSLTTSQNIWDLSENALKFPRAIGLWSQNFGIETKTPSKIVLFVGISQTADKLQSSDQFLGWRSVEFAAFLKSVSMGERKQDIYSVIAYINKSYPCPYRFFCLPFLLAVSARFKSWQNMALL